MMTVFSLELKFVEKLLRNEFKLDILNLYNTSFVEKRVWRIYFQTILNCAVGYERIYEDFVFAAGSTNNIVVTTDLTVITEALDSTRQFSHV